jgi:hypothetical protein
MILKAEKMMTNKVMYTQEQMDIEVLKTQNTGVMKTLERLEQKVDSHFHWTMGLMFGLYTLGLSSLIGALGHAYGWF